jgi:hypothetical protein
MKKIILFSLASIFCSMVITKVNAIQWLTIKNKINLHNKLHHSRFEVILSKNASWEQLHKKQKDVNKLSNSGDSIARDYKQNPSDFYSELLKTTTKKYIEAIIQQEELAPRHYYNNPEDQKNYQILINDLRDQLRE